MNVCSTGKKKKNSLHPLPKLDLKIIFFLITNILTCFAGSFVKNVFFLPFQ